MKKSKFTVLFAVVAMLAVCTLTACFNFGGGEEKDTDIHVTYHLNGGYVGDDPDRTDDYHDVRPDYALYAYKPITAKKDTWYLEGWYFDEEFSEKFSEDRFVELYNAGTTIDLYAKWVDKITVTKDNFTEFFKVTSRWNGGLTAGANAAITYSFEPLFAYDPECSAESIEISVTPHLGSWNEGANTIYLQSDDDYYYYGQKRVGSSAAGTQFQIGSSTLSWTLVTESFELRLLHDDPLTVHFDLDGGECEKSSLTVEGGHKLLKSELPTPKKSGYKFMGWYYDSEYAEEYAERLVTREKTIYAKFLKEVKVTFHANGGDEEEPRELLDGDLINTYTPEREDYKFLGWYTDEAFGNKFEHGTRAELDDVDLYAKWAKIHTVTFEVNGGTPVEAQRIVDGDKPNLAKAHPTKSMRSFIGWYTDPECENAYEASAVNGDLTLYALWAREVTISNPTIEDLKQYLSFKITEEYTTETKNGYIYKYRQFKITASIKEEYLRLGLIVNGQIEIEFTNDKNQNCGNGYFNNFTLSTLNDKLSYEGEYSVESGYTAYSEDITWKLNTYLTLRVYLPEETDAD